MSAPYLVEIRTGGETKEYIRGIVRDVRKEFNIRGRRPVPHITLFGPYNTTDGYAAKDAVQRPCSEYRCVPYRINGFDTFGDDVVYLDVTPSAELRALRREIRDGLLPISYNYPDYDENKWHQYHITIANGFDASANDLLRYLQSEYNPDIDEYAKRVSAIKNRDLMWEWDLPTGEVLSKKEATSRHSWEQTISRLDGLQQPNDHAELAQEPNQLTKLRKWLLPV